MSTIFDEDVKRLAKLANLSIDATQEKELKNQLANIINYFEELNEVATDNVLPTSQTTGLVDVLREDKIDTTRILPKSSAMSEAENTNNGYFVVDQLIDKTQQ